MSCSTGGISNGSLICRVSVGITGAIARIGSAILRVMAFFISSCCNCRLVCAMIRFCLAVATELLACTTVMGARVPISTCFCVVGEGLVRQFQRSLLHLHVLVGVDQVPVDVLDLRHRLHDLVLVGGVHDGAVIASDADPAQVGVETEALQQVLPQLEAEAVS